MFDRTKFLIVHGVTAEEWSERYGLDPFTHPCCICGAPQTTSLPFAKGQLRGLVAPVCECGHPNPPFCVVRDPKFGDLLERGFEW